MSFVVIYCDYENGDLNEISFESKTQAIEWIDSNDFKSYLIYIESNAGSSFDGEWPTCRTLIKLKAEPHT